MIIHISLYIAIYLINIFFRFVQMLIKPLITLTEEAKKLKTTEELGKKSLHILTQLTRPRKVCVFVCMCECTYCE